MASGSKVAKSAELMVLVGAGFGGVEREWLEKALGGGRRRVEMGGKCEMQCSGSA